MLNSWFSRRRKRAKAFPFYSTQAGLVRVRVLPKRSWAHKTHHAYLPWMCTLTATNMPCVLYRVAHVCQLHASSAGNFDFVSGSSWAVRFSSAKICKGVSSMLETGHFRGRVFDEGCLVRKAQQAYCPSTCTMTAADFRHVEGTWLKLECFASAFSPFYTPLTIDRISICQFSLFFCICDRMPAGMKLTYLQVEMATQGTPRTFLLHVDFHSHENAVSFV